MADTPVPDDHNGSVTIAILPPTLCILLLSLMIYLFAWPHWRAPGLDDTGPSESGSAFDLDKTKITRIFTQEALDAVEHVGPRLVSRPLQFVRRSLCLERRDDAFNSAASSSATVPNKTPSQHSNSLAQLNCKMNATELDQAQPETVLRCR